VQSAWTFETCTTEADAISTRCNRSYCLPELRMWNFSVRPPMVVPALEHALMTFLSLFLDCFAPASWSLISVASYLRCNIFVFMYYIYILYIFICFISYVIYCVSPSVTVQSYKD